MLPAMSPESCHCMYWPAFSVYVVVVFAGAAATPVPAGNAVVGVICTVVLSVAATTCPNRSRRLTGADRSASAAR